MKRYARIQNGIVAELFSTEQDIAALFNPALVWVPVNVDQQVTEGWAHSNGNFAAPAPAPPPSSPTLEELRAQLQELTGRIAALSQRS